MRPYAQVALRANRTSSGMALAVLLCGGALAAAQLGPDELADLERRRAQEDWTFDVGPNAATAQPRAALAALAPPPNWQLGARFVDPGGQLRGVLPETFDWRAVTGLPPIRNQLWCGSCWAFATTGPLECAIRIHDGIDVDLSEQWLVSCNPYGYNCNGGWFVHQLHAGSADACGASGAVLESAFPYVAANAPCNGCPYERAYTIDNWAYVGNWSTVPTVEQIKQAIHQYGPIAAAVYAGDAFTAYSGGIFNIDEQGTVNHAIVIVGWDDEQGSSGVWIVRNSWGTNWGEGGYMRIEYGRSQIGYAANFIEYTPATALEATPATLESGNVAVGSYNDTILQLRNLGGHTLNLTAGGLAPPFTLVGNSQFTLGAGQTAYLTVRFAPTLVGLATSTLRFTGDTTLDVPLRGTGTGSSAPGDRCGDAPFVAPGTFDAALIGATNDGTATCGGGGTADVWWRFSAPYDGTATFDTAGSAVATVLSVYTDCAGTELGCATSITASDGNARVTVDMTQGATYAVRVAAQGDIVGAVRLNITAQHGPVTLGGAIHAAGGVPLSGVVLAGLPGAPVTNAAGEFRAALPWGFSGTLTPTKTGWTFDPPQRSFSGLAGDHLAADFTALPVPLVIAGQVLHAGGAGLGNVVIDGFATSVRTSADGRFTANLPYGFTGELVPQRYGYRFDPPRLTLHTLATSQTEVVFTAEPLKGALRIDLAPEPVLDGTGLWRIEHGAWQPSGALLSDLPVGVYVVEYAPRGGWVAPARELVQVSADQTLSLVRSYQPATGTLRIITFPSGAGRVSATPASASNGTYNAGTTVELSAQPAVGYRFERWQSSEGALVYVNPWAFTLESDLTVTAYFATLAGAETTLDSVVAGVTENAPPSQVFNPQPIACGGFGAGLAPALLLTSAGLCGWRLGRQPPWEWPRGS